MSILYESILDPVKTCRAVDKIKKRFFEQMTVKKRIWNALSNFNGKVPNRSMKEAFRASIFPDYTAMVHSVSDRIDIEVYGNFGKTLMDYKNKCYFKVPLEIPTGKSRPVLRLQPLDEFIKEQTNALKMLEEFPAGKISELCTEYNTSLKKICDIYKLFNNELRYTAGMLFDPKADYRDRGDIFAKGSFDV